MSLDSVGSEAGPDKQLLKKINELKPEAKLMAAGGVRGEEDLLDLAGIGTNGALVASALHKGKLSVNAIRQIMN